MVTWGGSALQEAQSLGYPGLKHHFLLQAGGMQPVYFYSLSQSQTALVLWSEENCRVVLGLSMLSAVATENISAFSSWGGFLPSSKIVVCPRVIVLSHAMLKALGISVSSVLPLRQVCSGIKEQSGPKS